MRTRVVIVAAAAMLLAAGMARAAITIPTVPVGNPGNAADTAAHSGNSAGQGSVAYTYNIGTYEVTAGQYTAFLNKVAATDTYGLYNTSMWSNSYGCKIQRSGSSGSYTYSVASDYANRPVNYVSWGDSARFANWLQNGQPTGPQNASTTEAGTYALNGATTNAQLIAVAVPSAATRGTWASGTTPKWLLTSEDEWYKAAYYKGGSTNAGYWDYPTSSNTVPGRDMADASGNNANYYTTGYLLGSPYYRTEVGEFQNSDSPYGTFDQGGNVWEWNEAVLYGLGRGLRGVSFSSPGSYLLASTRYVSDPSNESTSLGFRVSQVPEPASMAILVFGGLGMLMRRRGLRR